MVRVKPCAVLILYCICQLLSVSLAAPQSSWRADHDTHKLPGHIKHQHSQQQQQQHQIHLPQPQHYQSVTPATIDNAYYMGVDSNNAVNSAAVNVATDNNKPDIVDVQARDYFTANRIEKPRLLEQSDKRFDDGHYEYSYTLSNGDTRYERAYWLPTGSEIILARKGYYSYPLPNNKYYTVFYTSDQNGFQQDSSAYSNGQPTLPRTVTVPEHPVFQNQHGVIQHSNNIPAKPEVISGVQHNNNNYVVSHGTQLWKSQDTYNDDGSYNSHGEFKRVRRNINEQKTGESVDKTKSTSTTQKPQVKLPPTTETPVAKSENLQQAIPQPTVELPRIEDITSHAQQQVPVYSQQQNVPAYAHLRDPTYNVQNYLDRPIGQRQPFPVGGTYSVPNQLNTLNRQTLPVSSQSSFNAFNTLNGPILGHRQSQTQQPQTQEQQQQQILNQNALLNYLASRLSNESPESYSQESHEVYLPGLLGGINQYGGLIGGTAGEVTNQQTRRRIRGNIPIWPLQQQRIAQPFY